MQTEQKFSAMELGLAQKLGRSLDEREQYDLDLYLKGRALSNVVPTEGWQIAMETLQKIKDDAVEQLLYAVKPGDTDRVLAQHAVAWGMVQMYEAFVKGINDALEAPYPQFAEQAPPDTI